MAVVTQRLEETGVFIFDKTLGKNQSITSLIHLRKGADAILKFVLPWLELSYHCVQSKGDEVTAQQLSNSMRVLQGTRDTLCLFSLPAILQSVVFHIERLASLVFGFVENRPVVLKAQSNGLLRKPDTCEREIDDDYGRYIDNTGHRYEYNEVAVTPEEKIASTGATFLKAMAGGINIFNFGISKPIGFVETYVGAPLSDVVRSIGNAFSTTFCVYHAVEAAGHVADFIYQRLAFERAWNDVDRETNNDKIGSLSHIVDRFYNKVTDLCVNLAEKAFELLQDILYLSGQIIPVPARISLNLVLASFTLYQVWYSL